MTELIVNKEKFIIIRRKEYESLQKKAALKNKPEKTLSLAEARVYSKALIRKWAKEKSR
jgi:PHD/YefM family antitoxin component YafN of YafNO toxin-antitoxin module